MYVTIHHITYLFCVKGVPICVQVLASWPAIYRCYAAVLPLPQAFQPEVPPRLDDMSSATHATESRVIPCPLHILWQQIVATPLRFWKTAVQSVEVVSGSPTEVGAQFIVQFKDGTRQRLQINELSELHHHVTYELLESDPPVYTLAALHTIRLVRVTHDNSTYVELSAQFTQRRKHYRSRGGLTPKEEGGSQSLSYALILFWRSPATIYLPYPPCKKTAAPSCSASSSPLPSSPSLSRRPGSIKRLPLIPCWPPPRLP
ncbi:uncharacterized protein EV422DRAFT_556413 [Fimicolochytrium jonesii]|uniref:uncharacterized protein n=1 Tax=Fimicolochytrium jonesii TaxID=1396493 RepID=UPI0022FEB0E4|nr:uncharacterized protein EV422DRAFT_556413 [Fimicolochytrium jonesii]KAI8821675.1 hypothetical protein EV422DRAFT_556413 [Fimicolochytrium jonesii]